ncbi:MAG: hypothetical protein ACJ72D_15900 [Marmoricola sp.]
MNDGNENTPQPGSDPDADPSTDPATGEPIAPEGPDTGIGLPGTQTP